MMKPHVMGGMTILAPLRPEYSNILTPQALGFVAELARTYTSRVNQLLQRRREMQSRYDAGEHPHFLEETRWMREENWKVAPLPDDLQDRRVEITGPTDRKMVINALNSGANVYMPDFEDSNCPTWDNLVSGQQNLYEAVRGTITLNSGGKTYRLGNKRAVMIVRPRGWHLWEKHVLVDGNPVPGALFDFGLHFFHNARYLIDHGSGPYYYLPKMQSHLECRLWNDVFLTAQRYLGIPRGTIKATCLIETLPAAFEMDEFLYELREHSAGLNCGRWDYMFSALKTLRADPSRIFPDRSYLTMEMPFMRAYTQLVIKTCHRRGVHAIGGMSAFIPIKNDERANQAVMDKVKSDKLREVRDGHDGTWVAHPGLIKIARDIFDEHMKTPNQIDRLREDVSVTAADLLAVPDGPRTKAALRNNINVAIQYLEAWLGGNGCVPLHNLMEDAATAEISRTQVWQWVRYGATLDDGQPLTRDAVAIAIQDELDEIRRSVGSAKFSTAHYLEAAALFKQMISSRDLPDFLTLPAYEALIAEEFGSSSEARGAGAAHSKL
jgi:malate synthase